MEPGKEANKKHNSDDGSFDVHAVPVVMPWATSQNGLLMKKTRVVEAPTKVAKRIFWENNRVPRNKRDKEGSFIHTGPDGISATSKNRDTRIDRCVTLPFRVYMHSRDQQGGPFRSDLVANIPEVLGQ